MGKLSSSGSFAIAMFDSNGLKEVDVHNTDSDRVSYFKPMTTAFNW